MSARGFRAEHLLLVSIGSALVLFLLVPILALVVTTNATELAAAIRHPLVRPALALSLFTTSVSAFVVVCLGTPVAWTLASSHSRAARVVETSLQLPIVVPPAVAGIALLLAFGRRGLLAGLLYPTGSSLAFTTSAVVLAEIFVSAPLFLQGAIAAFRRIDPRLITVSRTFGASPLRIFLRIAVPLAAPGLAASAAMSWARSLGEFGATLMFAGNLEGETQTLPLAIYTALESDMRVAQALSLLLVAVAFVFLALARLAGARANDASRSEP